ncbi:hypothetical protein [Micromonospora sp. NBC_01796]|uniref:hypothetical protein n=1 Tax=Micromonospora sp. NBC_01796 TaxID=2975987 RepID=UPI002DD9BC50|nr:hypothetical protein [Micromonospora sp. NBC_01796]WSA83805.1 hypothetical protein OIE47_25970 [Micromonospora sp. NBC_01796]
MMLDILPETPGPLISDVRQNGAGPGDWVPVISTMGDNAYDESDLRSDLTAQQDATTAAVIMLHSLRHPKTQP